MKNHKKIPSFTINHEMLQRGVYVSRQDGDIVTFDLRMRRPYAEPVLTDVELHSLEHLLATGLRNGSCGKNIVYVGPMGCATGFYVLSRGISVPDAVRAIADAFGAIADAKAMPGDSRVECGNCRTLDLAEGKRAAAEYYAVIRGKTCPDEYPA